VVPALAIADALRAEAPVPPRIVFIGGERAERDLVPAAGFELRTVTVEGLSRSNPLKAARAAVKAAGAVRAARAASPSQPPRPVPRSLSPVPHPLFD